MAAQNLVEFWAAATRPEGENGLGMSVEAATRELAALKRLFSLLPECRYLANGNGWPRSKQYGCGLVRVRIAG